MSEPIIHTIHTAGISSRKKECQVVEKYIAETGVYPDIFLLPDLKNDYDPNAIAIFVVIPAISKPIQIGFVPKTLNADIHPFLDSTTARLLWFGKRKDEFGSRIELVIKDE